MEGIPYSDQATFYANERSKRIIVVQSNFMGKGWYHIIVGEKEKRTRNPNEIHQLLQTYYPNYKKISLFSETSYHSGLRERGRITKYGTEDYTLQYSTYKPLGTYILEQPIKTQMKGQFGKVRKRITLQEWTYIVLNWIPETPVKLKIRHVVSNPFGEKKVIYESKRYPITEKQKAIADFKEYVRRHG